MLAFPRSIASRRNYRIGCTLREKYAKQTISPPSQFPCLFSSARQEAFITSRRSAVRSFKIARYHNSCNEIDSEIEEKVSKWIKNVVIGLNFCPFAEKSRSNKHLFTTVVRGSDVEEILSVVLYESILRKDDEGTTVVICPDLFPSNFIDFYEKVVMAEEMLFDQDMEGIIQIAPFHPLFRFEGSGEDGVDNLTNRAPYPIFHILREEEVSSAVNKLDGDSSKVWQRNIDLLDLMEEKYGRETTEKIMAGEKIEGLGELMRSLKLDDNK
eukprot:scaffold3453_cov256-Chaetoceros_neogracile.AAC.44